MANRGTQRTSKLLAREPHSRDDFVVLIEVKVKFRDVVEVTVEGAARTTTLILRALHAVTLTPAGTAILISFLMSLIVSLNSNVHTRTRVSHSAQITRTRKRLLSSRPLAWGFHPATAIVPHPSRSSPLRPRSRSKPNASHSKRAFRPPPPPSTPRIARAFLERATAPIDLGASRLEVLPRPIALASTSRDAHHPLARARGTHPRLAFASLILASRTHLPESQRARRTEAENAPARVHSTRAGSSTHEVLFTVYDSSEPRARPHSRTPLTHTDKNDRRGDRPIDRRGDRPIDRRGDRPIDRWVTARRRRTPPRVARARGSRVSTWTAEDARATPDRR